MGTNWYATKRANLCEHCGRADEEEFHIGKSSVGWCFGLHVIPEEGLTSWKAWQEFLSQPGVTISNEYGDEVTLEEFREWVEDRGTPGAVFNEPPEWMSSNNALPGPRGLARHALSRWCVGHGEGTWDLLSGDFS